MPTVQGTDDFNHAIDTSFYDAVFGTPASVLSPLYQSQPRSLEIISAGSNIGVRKNLSGPPVRGWAAFPVRVAALPAADVVFLIFQSAGGDNARIYINAAGNIRCHVAGQSLQTGPVLTAGTWYWVEAIFDVSGTTHTLYWRVAGVDQTSSTRTGQAADTVTYNQLLSVSGDAALTWHAGMWKWGSAASATDWLGEPSPGVFVSADFRMPYEIEGPAIADTLGELPTTTLVQTVTADKDRPPTASDDVLAGHGPGDVWIHAATGWWCTSAAAGAAVWKQVTT